MSEIKRITLYAAVDSPFPHRVLLALEEAKAKYDVVWINLINKEEWYEEKVNTNGGRVPFLVYGGPELRPGDALSPDSFLLSESLIIMEFLADLFPDAKLLPADPIARAKARLFAHLVDTKFIPAFAGCVFLGGPPEPLYAMLDTLQAFLPPDGGYVAGDWSIADAAFIPWFLRLEAILALNPVTMSPEVAEAASGMVRSERFARLQQWKRDNVARPTMAKTYDEPAVVQKWHERMERFQKTGKLNSDITLPIPQK